MNDRDFAVADTTRRAEEAGRLVSETRENAEHSGLVVTNAIDAMNAIEASSMRSRSRPIFSL
jgi:methyl-accepting chemotaxis protein